MKTATRHSASAAAAPKRLITAGDLARLIGVSDPRVSPDGQTIAFVRKHVGEKNDYVANIWVVPVAGGEARQFTAGGKDSQPRFSDDGQRLAFVSGRDKPRPQLFVMSSTGGEALPLTQFPEGQIREFQWSPDGSLLAVSFRAQEEAWTEQARKDRAEKGLSDPPRVLDDLWYRLDGDGYFNAQRYQLYVVDSTTGQSRVVYTQDTLGMFSFCWSPDSKQLAIATNRDPKALIRPWKDELVRLHVATGTVTAIPDLPEGPKLSVAWSPDGRRIAYAGRHGRDGAYSVENLELYVCDPASGGARSLTGQTDLCLMATCLSDTAEVQFAPAMQFSPDGRLIYARIGRQGESHVAVVPAAGGKLRFLTSQVADHQMGNLSRKGSVMALTVATATAPGEIYAGAVKAGAVALRKLTDFNGPLLRDCALARPTEHWVTAEDGARVHVWKMEPPAGARRERMPAILEIHGGPHAQYGVGFFHEFQVLAAQGYVVFYSNPRGSKGYGRDHCAAIRGSWGGADWRDIQAVIAFMKAQPNVDAGRLGVMGGSYGGYMTNWVIGHTHDFAAAITDRCVANLVSMFGSSDLPDAPDTYFPGNSWDRPEAMWNMSPLKYLGQARTPTLIIHSEGDLRCNIEQAEQVFTALSLNNVPVRFVRYPRNTSHGLSRSGPPDMRLHRLEQILAWWRKYLA